MGRRPASVLTNDGLTARSIHHERKDGCAMTDSRHDIIDNATSAGSFHILVAAVNAAGLISTLRSEGPFMVFAPTDEAFSKMPPGFVDSLLEPENKYRLASVLMYHVVPGAMFMADVTGQSITAASVQGEALDIEGITGLMVNGTKVVSAEIQCTNGVIHAIDDVLLPIG